MSSAAPKNGYVLPLVLGVVLAVSCLLSTLLGVPGGLRRYVFKSKTEIQGIYNAESSIMAYLYRAPLNESVAPVDARLLGPYREICAEVRMGSPDISSRRLCVQTVGRFHALRYADWQKWAGSYRSRLYESLEGAVNLRHLSGNRRFFALDSSVSLHVHDGDAELNIDGRVPVVNLLVDGSVSVSGNASYDTLRIFSQGNVTVKGGVKIVFLEIFAGGPVEIAGNATFRGIVLSTQKFVLENRSQGLYPSFAIAMGYNDPYGELKDRASFEGLLAAPSGEVVVRPGCVYDTSRRVLPVFDEVEELVFDRRFYP